MKTLNFETARKNATDRVNKYVSGLKHGDSLKYVKSLDSVQKTLFDICLHRQNLGQILELKNSEMEAFGMKPTDKNGMAFLADINIYGRPTVYPIYEI